MRKALPGTNKGTTMIIFTLALTVILSSAALVIDVGNMVIERQKLQNAVDAAALAAAYELPDTSAALAAAQHYAQANGVGVEDISVTFSDSDKTVDVKANKTVNFYFARVLGINNANTGANAAATADTLGGPFNYTLFSGSTTSTLTMNGSSMYIDGSSHSNDNFIVNGSSLTITGTCEASSNIMINGSSVNVDDRIPDAPCIDMPDFSETIRMQAENAGNLFVGDKVFDGSDINVDEPIYVEGNVTIDGSNFTGKGCILATGTITFNGSNLTDTSQDAVCFYSENGGIIVNGSGSEVDGILYAPNGSILLNGSNQTINGRVIGQSVIFNGSGLYCIGGGSELESLPTYGVKLIQ